MSTVKECNYRSVALASIRSFAVVRAVLTYVFERSSGFREYRLAREEERRQTGPRAGRIVTQRLPTRVDYQ